jgi:hypothetical protein
VSANSLDKPYTVSRAPEQLLYGPVHGVGRRSGRGDRDRYVTSALERVRHCHIDLVESGVLRLRAGVLERERHSGSRYTHLRLRSAANGVPNKIKYTVLVEGPSEIGTGRN